MLHSVSGTSGSAGSNRPFCRPRSSSPSEHPTTYTFIHTSKARACRPDVNFFDVGSSPSTDSLRRERHICQPAGQTDGLEIAGRPRQTKCPELQHDGMREVHHAQADAQQRHRIAAQVVLCHIRPR